jgi:hypothetical protein
MRAKALENLTGICHKVIVVSCVNENVIHIYFRKYVYESSEYDSGQHNALETCS